eukprot:c5801_g1_i1.p1 GENE.c5801_g1_i1~~c5801_g1_i1.p1  ORF type:complete len:355 (+),score=105.76 c5801_g1_i1:48-1067(+)
MSGFSQLVEDDSRSPIGVRLTPAGACGCGVLGVIAFIGIILIISSVDTVEPLEFGLNYSTWSKSIVDNRVYAPGRYFLGLGHTFVHFPNTIQTISFGTLPGSMYGPIRAKTGRGDTDIGESGGTSNGGLNITLSIALQYKFSPNNLHAMFRNYKLNYQTPFRLEFEEAIRQVASTFTQFDYWKGLDHVVSEMHSRINKSATSMNVQFLDVQLLEILLDARFENALVRTQVEQERKKLAEFELQVESIRQETEVLRAQANATIRVINATAMADQTRVVKEAEAKALAAYVNVQGETFGGVMSTLAFSPDDIVRYSWYKVLETKPDAKVFVGINPSPVTSV